MLANTDKRDIFLPHEAVATKIYAALDWSGDVCIVAPGEYLGDKFSVLILQQISELNGYTLTLGLGTSPVLDLPDLLSEMQGSNAFPGPIYEFDDLLEFLEWAVEQERARVEGRDG